MTTGLLTSAQLLKLEEADFDGAILKMPTKGLMETITFIQKEMNREQEHFNSLSAELVSVKKNSGQYKSISKEMAASQACMNVLMTRSMKCFTQERNQQSKDVERRNSFSKLQGEEVLNKHFVSQIASHSDKSNTNQSQLHSDITLGDLSDNKTMIQIQSIKMQCPISSSNIVTVNGNIVQNGHNTSDNIQVCPAVESAMIGTPTHTNDSMKNLGLTISGNIKNGAVCSESQIVSPLCEQENKITSRSSDNIPACSVSSRSDVKSSKISMPITKVVMNADKQMIDLDSFTDRRNMLHELKKFDKTLKTVTKTNISPSEEVTEVKLNFGKSKDSGSDGKLCDSAAQKGSLLSDIRKGNNLKSVNNGEKRKENEILLGVTEQNDKKENSICFGTHDPGIQGFDDLLKDIEDVQNSDNSSNTTLKAETPDDILSKEIRSDINIENLVTLNNSGNTINNDVKKACKEHGRNHSIEDSDVSHISNVSDGDHFVTELKFLEFGNKSASTGLGEKPQTKVEIQALAAPKSMDASPVVKNKEVQSLQVHVKSKETSAIANVTIQSNHGNQSATDDRQEIEELVKDTRVKFRDWDPSLLLAELYKVQMMPDDIEDISHKFIGMEGLMEKLPMNKKKATLLKTWKRRFFRAKDGWLHYYENNNRDKPSDSLQLMGGKVEEIGPRVLGIDDGRGKYLMVRVPTDNEYGLWKVALESQTADNVKATYVRPSPASIPHPHKKVVIIDIGSSSIRAGILGERPTLPQLFFPSTIAIEQQTGEIIVGIEALHPEVRKKSTLVQPIKPTNKVDKGQVLSFNIDMNVMTAILKKVFVDLGVNQTQYLVMLSTPQNLCDKLKESLMKILLDEYHVLGVCMVHQSLLAMYSYNAMSGIIVDFGERLEILPIYDGLLLEGGVSRQAYGGTKIQDSLYIALLENKYKFNTPVEKLLIRYICEQICYVAANYKEAKEKCDADPVPFTRTVHLSKFNLPEGADSEVSLNYGCFKSPEGVFNTELWEMDYKNIQKQIYNAIQQCPMDARKHMYRSVYLSGGVVAIPGFAERLEIELKKLAPPAAIVEVHASPQRYHAAYIGACSVASMDIFETNCVMADEWKHSGVKACKKWGTG